MRAGTRTYTWLQCGKVDAHARRHTGDLQLEIRDVVRHGTREYMDALVSV